MKSKNFTSSTISNSLLSVLFILISIVCIYVLVGAYLNIQSASHLVKVTTIELNNRLNNPKLTKTDSILIQNEKAFLNQYEIRTKGTLDSTTISFLFQIFAIALVSAGVYLFSNAHKDYRKIKKTAQQYDQKIRYFISITSLLNNIYSLSWNIRIDTTNNRIGMIAQLRKYIFNLSNLIINEDTKEGSLDKKIIEDIYIILHYCKINLNFRMQTTIKFETSDILTMIEDIIKHLQKRYKSINSG